MRETVPTTKLTEPPAYFKDDNGELLNEPQIDERNRLVERKEIPLFDMDAFREATINAFLHNDWTTGNEPMFTAYSNRIEIPSRGSIPQNLMSFTLGPLLHSQMESSPWHLDARQ